MQAAGVEVIAGVCGAEARQLNRAFIHRVTTGRPLGILKWAMSLDGRTALPNGSSQWISGPEARAWVHRLRGQVDAVIVGGGSLFGGIGVSGGPGGEADEACAQAGLKSIADALEF